MQLSNVQRVVALGAGTIAAGAMVNAAQQETSSVLAGEDNNKFIKTFGMASLGAAGGGLLALTMKPTPAGILTAAVGGLAIGAVGSLAAGTIFNPSLRG